MFYIVSESGLSYDEALNECEGFFCGRHLEENRNDAIKCYGSASIHTVCETDLRPNAENCIDCCDNYWDSYRSTLEQEAQWDAQYANEARTLEKNNLR